jgi:lipopolysaccharide biosynthesis glycosyltransferase
VLAFLLGLAQAQTTPEPKRPAVANKASSSVGRTWDSLSAEEKVALKPLELQWNQLNPVSQKKWLEISHNYDKMPQPQQQALHERMGAWAKMAPSERAKARLNFAETQKATQTLTPEERRAKWEAYQALSPEEKQRLAKVQASTKTTAPAIQPVPPQKLTALPNSVTSNAAHHSKATTTVPRIAVGPHQVQRNTLLPQRDPAVKQ